jgi:4'-phosphopantetheinyl transferase
VFEPVQRLPPIVPEETLASAVGRVDLWCFFYEGISDPSLLAAYDGLMTPDERARHRRYLFEKDRLLFLATRALVRTALSRYSAVEPAAWRFAEGERGRPYLIGPKTDLHFNLSNTRGLVVCAVSARYERVGADTEPLDRPGETVAIAEHYFSRREVAALTGQPAARQRERFFAYWTLKESYIKARGLGLAIPLDQFSFLLDEGPEIGIAFDPRLADDPARWRFALLSAGPRHLVAVGADTGGAPLSLRGACFVPLQGVVAYPPSGP